MAMANNFSQMIAMFCLILFYTVFKEELQPLSPIKQYLCIKFVVFATFWQSILIAILVKFKLISVDQWPYFPTLVDTVNGLQDFLICIEMFVASIAHILAFPVKPYKVEQPLNWWSNIANAGNLSDLHSEVSTHYQHFYVQVSGLFKKSQSSINSSSVRNLDDCDDTSSDEANENTRLLNDQESMYIF
jgi:hypothetical protein